MGQGLFTGQLTVIQVVFPVLCLNFAQWRGQGGMHLLVRNHVRASIVMQLMDHSRAPDDDREDAQGQDVQALDAGDRQMVRKCVAETLRNSPNAMFQ